MRDDFLGEMSTYSLTRISVEAQGALYTCSARDTLTKRTCETSKAI